MNKLKSDLLMIKRGFSILLQIEKAFVILVFCTSALASLQPFFNIYMSATIINELAGQCRVETLIVLVLVTICINLAASLILSRLEHLRDVHGDLFEKNKELLLNQKILTTDYENIESFATHILRRKITEADNYGRLFYCLLRGISHVTEGTVKIAASTILALELFTSSTSSALSSIFVLAAIVSATLVTMAASKKIQLNTFTQIDKVIKMNRKVDYFLYNYLSDYKVGKDVRIFNQKDLLLEEAGTLLDDAIDVNQTMMDKNMKHEGIQSIASNLLGGGVYLYVALQAVTGALSLGNVVKYVSCINQFISGFSQLMTSFTELRANNPYLQYYFDFIDMPDKMYHGTLPVEKRNDNEYEIEFKNVSFKYPASEAYVLRNITLKFQIGERLAVVGMNGSGKTTFIKLLCRLYDPTEGEILLNGIDIRKYDYNEYISIFSVVFQDFKLFSFSLGQNIAASTQYDREKTEGCLKQAGLEERLKTLENGLDTLLFKDFEENGVEISGGEAQKAALARALYKDAPFIVLDEPTAALDPIAEFEVYSKFNEIVGTKTAIYISHRLSSCRFCDNIAVFHEGKIIQRGSHDALLTDQDGKYAELWYAQAQYYEDSKLAEI